MRVLNVLSRVWNWPFICCKFNEKQSFQLKRASLPRGALRKQDYNTIYISLPLPWKVFWFLPCPPDYLPLWRFQISYKNLSFWKPPQPRNFQWSSRPSLCMDVFWNFQFSFNSLSFLYLFLLLLLLFCAQTEAMLSNNLLTSSFLPLFPFAEHHNPRQVCLVKVFHSTGEHCYCYVHYSWSSVHFDDFETYISMPKIS